MRRYTPTPRRSNSGLTRRRLLLAGAEVAGAASLASVLSPLGAVAQTAVDITTTDLGELYVFQGAGCNVVAMPGDDGALMIDGGLARNADALLAAVQAATGNDRVEMLVNTHWHPEQTGANEIVGREGGVIFAQEKTAMYLSHITYPDSFNERVEPLPEIARPNRVTRGDGMLEFAGHEIDYGYLPQAHTDGDLYLHFPDENLLVGGGVVSGEAWPEIDYRNGAWYGGRVRALEWLAELVRPDTRVVPAQGRLIDGRTVMRLNDIYQELFLTMIDYMNKGFGPEDAAASNPLAPYEDEFGDAREFLYDAYRSMLIAYVPE
jgi:glyoxylase-like metal-dependent hydrolase (beta-lactamase superfamily II)